MIERVSAKTRSPGTACPWRFEAGTPDIAGVIALGEALQYLKKIGWEALHAHEQDLVGATLKAFAKIEGLRLYGPAGPEKRVAVFSFNLAGINAQDVGALLDSMGLALRVGNHCAQPLMARFACPGMVRASFYLYNTVEEVEKLAEALVRIQKMLGKEAAPGNEPSRCLPSCRPWSTN